MSANMPSEPPLRMRPHLQSLGCQELALGQSCVFLQHELSERSRVRHTEGRRSAFMPMYHI